MDLPGHLAAGEEGGAGLGVVVIADGWRLTGHVRDLCDRLVREGFTALALDLPAPSADIEEAARAVAPAIERFAVHDAVRGDGVGVVGFGPDAAALALWLAIIEPGRVVAAVPFYGLPAPDRSPDWTALQASVEGHFAGDDHDTGQASVQGFEEELSDLGKDVRVFTYPGARPGFFDDTRADAYDSEAARQAWVRTLEFLRAKLG